MRDLADMITGWKIIFHKRNVPDPVWIWIHKNSPWIRILIKKWMLWKSKKNCKKASPREITSSCSKHIGSGFIYSPWIRILILAELSSCMKSSPSRDNIHLVKTWNYFVVSCLEAFLPSWIRIYGLVNLNPVRILAKHRSTKLILFRLYRTGYLFQ
jgi:hypothetical protein